MTEIRASPTPEPPVIIPSIGGDTGRARDRRLRIAISSRLEERQAIEDVMQEVALAAARQRSPLAEAKKVGAWLRQIAHRANAWSTDVGAEPAMQAPRPIRQSGEEPPR